MPLPQLQRGVALVLTGPQGCGKTTLARQIAAAHGSYTEILAEHFDNPLQLGAALAERTRTLVVAGLPTTASGISTLKLMLTDDTVVAQRKHMRPITVPAPQLVFHCNSGDAKFIKAAATDRRFRVIDLTQESVTP